MRFRRLALRFVTVVFAGAVVMSPTSATAVPVVGCIPLTIDGDQVACYYVEATATPSGYDVALDIRGDGYTYDGTTFFFGPLGFTVPGNAVVGTLCTSGAPGPGLGGGVGAIVDGSCTGAGASVLPGSPTVSPTGGSTGYGPILVPDICYTGAGGPICTGPQSISIYPTVSGGITVCVVAGDINNSSPICRDV